MSSAIVKDDHDDNIVVECAFACSADYIVTGDNHLLKIEKYGKTKIVTASAFVNFLQQ